MDMVASNSDQDQQQHKMNNNRLIQQQQDNEDLDDDCEDDDEGETEELAELEENDSLMNEQAGQDSLIEDSECTFGSPAGLRQDVMDEDDDTKEESSALNNHSSPKLRNKRKNFKPRNIINKKDSPMDLSVQGAASNGDRNNSDVDDMDDEESDSQPAAAVTSSAMASGLSVVRPEVLFGQEGMPMPVKMPTVVPPMAGAMLAPFLAASASGGQASMKDAFQEVLKLFGFPPELAEVFAKNAQALQQQQQHRQESDDTVLTAAGPGQDQGKLFVYKEARIETWVELDQRAFIFRAVSYEQLDLVNYEPTAATLKWQMTRQKTREQFLFSSVWGKKKVIQFCREGFSHANGSDF